MISVNKTVTLRTKVLLPTFSFDFFIETESIMIIFCHASFVFSDLNEVEQIGEPRHVKHITKRLAHAPYADVLALWLGIEQQA